MIAVKGSKRSIRKMKSRLPRYPELDSKVLEWVKVEQEKGGVLTQKVVRDMAVQFSMDLGMDKFSASHSWLSHFQARCKIDIRSTHKKKKRTKKSTPKDPIEFDDISD